MDLMNTPPPPTASNLLRQVAARLRTDGARTAQAVIDWGAGGTGDDGPRQAGTHTDPTGRLVAEMIDHTTTDAAHLNRRPDDPPCPICVALLPHRWRTATLTVRNVAERNHLPGALGLPLATVVDLLADRCEQGRVAGAHRHQLTRAARELDRIMAETVPLTRVEAMAILDAERRHRAEAELYRCAACESTETSLKGGYGVDCHSLLTTWRNRGDGRAIDEETFRSTVLAMVQRKELNRPLSPHYGKAAPAYEDDHRASA